MFHGECDGNFCKVESTVFCPVLYTEFDRPEAGRTNSGTGADRNGGKMSNDYKKVVRSRTNRVICGVCGGIGEYLNVDPTLIRLGWVVCSMVSCGTGLIVYLVAGIIMPEDNDVIG